MAGLLAARSRKTNSSSSWLIKRRQRGTASPDLAFSVVNLSPIPNMPRGNCPLSATTEAGCDATANAFAGALGAAVCPQNNPGNRQDRTATTGSIQGLSRWIEHQSGGPQAHAAPTAQWPVRDARASTVPGGSSARPGPAWPRNTRGPASRIRPPSTIIKAGQL